MNFLKKNFKNRFAEEKAVNFPANIDSRPHYERNVFATQKHISFEGQLDHTNKTLDAIVTITFKVVSNPQPFLEIDAKELSINKVLFYKNSTKEYIECDFSEEKNLLKIHTKKFKNLIQKSDLFKIVINYRIVSPRKGLFFINKDHTPESYNCIWTQGQDTDTPFWLPCQDNPKLKVTTEMTLTYPSNWEMESNGILEYTDQNNNHKTSRWVMEQPLSPYLIALAGGEFKKFVSSWRGKPIYVYLSDYFGYLGQKILDMTIAQLEFYSNLWDFEFPWPKYAQIFVKDFPFGGMENTCLTINSDKLLGCSKLMPTQENLPIVVMHELAHHWFGDFLTCESWSEGWLNEGFATHSELLYEEWLHGEISGCFFNDLYFRSKYLKESLEYQRPLVTNVYEYPSEIFDAHLYEKGALILHHLRDTLGHEHFTKAVNKYLNDNKFGAVNTFDLIHAIEEETGWNPRSYIDQFVLNPGHIILDISYKYSNTTNDLLLIEVYQKQEKRVFNFHTFVTMIYSDGTTEEKEIYISQKHFSLKIEAKPTLAFVVLDPRGSLVGTATHKWDTSDALKILKTSNNSFWKFLAIKSLFSENILDENMKEVHSWLEHEKLLLARKAAIIYLGETGNSQAFKILNKLKDLNPILQKYWLIAISKTCPPGSQEEVLNTYLSIINDKNALPGHIDFSLKALLIFVKRTPLIHLEPYKATILKCCQNVFSNHITFSQSEASAAELMGYLGTWDECKPLFIASLEKETPWPKRIGALRGIALLMKRFPHKAFEGRAYLTHWSKEWHPIQLPAALPEIWVNSNDEELESEFENWLKHYSDYGNLIPSARRQFNQLTKKLSNKDNRLERELAFLKEKVISLESAINLKKIKITDQS